jgi:hypothetical protein
VKPRGHMNLSSYLFAFSVLFSVKY